MKIFGQRYSAVNTTDSNCDNGNHQQNASDTHEKFRKSLQTKRTLSRGLSLVDTVFFKQKSERGPKWPKGLFVLWFFLLCFYFLFVDFVRDDKKNSVRNILHFVQAYFLWEMKMSYKNTFKLRRWPPDYEKKTFVYANSNSRNFCFCNFVAFVSFIFKIIKRCSLVIDYNDFIKNSSTLSLQQDYFNVSTYEVKDFLYFVCV